MNFNIFHKRIIVSIFLLTLAIPLFANKDNISIDDELISELVNYLECYNNDYELEGNTIEERIDKLTEGANDE